LVDRGIYSGTQRILTSEELITTTSGTNMHWKVGTFGKRMRIYGVGLLWE
jgi:hypothetical protein